MRFNSSWIAIRELTSGVTGDPVIVEIGAPRVYPSDPRMWVCPYKITGIGLEPPAGSLPGGDSVEALQSCLSVINPLILSTGHPVNHNGNDDIGFPRLYP